MAPPIDKRNDFMSIDRVGDDRTAFENQLRPQRPTAIAIGESAPTNTDIDKQRALLQAQNIDMTGGLGSNNFSNSDDLRARQEITPLAPQGKMPSQATLDNLEDLRNNPGPGIPIGFGSYGPGGNLEMSDNGLNNYLPDYNVSDLPGGMGGPVNPGSAPMSPPPTNGMPPVNPNLTGVTQPDPSAPVNPTTTQQPPVGINTVDPVLQSQVSNENLTDPLIRQLYFGTEDAPGFYNQLQQAGANLIGSDVPLQDTSGLNPLELQARQRAQEGLGQFQPYFTQQQDLINEAIGQSRRAEQLQDPYFSQAEQQYGQGLDSTLSGIDQARQMSGNVTDQFGRRLSDVEQRGEGAAGRFGQELRGIESGVAGSVDEFGNRLGESESLLRGTLGGYDPSMTSQFYNPYEDRVVDQTIQDVMDAGDKQDISARAQAIGAGAFGGSRARLGAEERREALGRGLGEALAGIRQGGFQQAQQTGMAEFARQRDAERAAASGLSGFAGSRFGAQQGLGQTLTSGAQQRLAADKGVIDLLGQGAQSRYGAGTNLAGNLQQYGQSAGAARQGMGGNLLNIGQQRGAGAAALGSNLANYGSQMGNMGANIEQLRSGQRSELAGYGQQGRSISEQENLRNYQQQLQQQLRPMQTIQGIGALLPGYQQASTNIQSQYGQAPDPTATGLGAAFSAYGALAPRQGTG
tara:strand:- start:3093 stop:5159 length:2067 start_codon:yes stop_codon:yes gene_type:complete